jgi:hypothetical protein
LERRVGAGEFEFLQEVTDRLDFTDSGLMPGETYAYRVTLRTLAGESPAAESAPLTLPLTAAVPTSGMQLWLRSTAGLASTEAVATWADQSGAMHAAAQSDPTRQPKRVADAFGGAPVVRFSGAQELLLPEGLLAVGAPLEIVALVKVADKTTGAYGGNMTNELWRFGDRGTSYYREPGITLEEQPHATYLHANGFGLANEWVGAVPVGQVLGYHMHVTSVSPARWETWVNGVSVAAVDAPALAPMTGLASLGAGLFAGDFVEVLVYDRTLSPAERAAIQAHWADRYAVPAPPVPSWPAGETLVSVFDQPPDIGVFFGLVIQYSSFGDDLSFEIERRPPTGTYSSFVVLANRPSLPASNLVVSSVHRPQEDYAHYYFRARTRNLRSVSNYGAERYTTIRFSE